jgi:CDP-diglyceride synthetase
LPSEKAGFAVGVVLVGLIALLYGISGTMTERYNADTTVMFAGATLPISEGWTYVYQYWLAIGVGAVLVIVGILTAIQASRRKAQLTSPPPP